MLIEKIAEMYARSTYKSNNQIITQKLFELQDSIGKYSLKEFIGETKVSKSAVQRFLKEIGIHEFKSFRRSLYLEFYRFQIRLDSSHSSIDEDLIRKFDSLLKKSKRIFIVGDSSIINIFKLYLPYFLIKKYPIYIYEGVNFSHEADKIYHFTENDCIIHGSLTSSFENIKENSELNGFFTVTGNSFKARIVFIGQIYFNHHADADFIIPLSINTTLTQKIKYICSILETLLF